MVYWGRGKDGTWDKLMSASGKNLLPRRWFLWGLGNLLILAGLFALLYVGGLYLRRNGGHLAVSDLPPTPEVRRAPALALTPTPTPAPTPSPALPVLNQEPTPRPLPPPVVDPTWHSNVTRIVIPEIDLDSAVVEVGWHVEEVNGQRVAVWDVAEYAVGHHHASGNAGGGTNIVLAAHAGGYGGVFRRLIELEPADEVLLYADGRQYLYVVEEIVLVQEVGVPMEVRLENARYTAPSEEERVTLITCWPVPVYDQRIIVLARPYRAEPFPRPDLIAD